MRVGRCSGPGRCRRPGGAWQQVEHERRADGHGGQGARHRQRHRAADPAAASPGAGRGVRGDGEGQPSGLRGTAPVPRFRRRMRGGRPVPLFRYAGTGQLPAAPARRRRRHHGWRPESSGDHPGRGGPGDRRPGGRGIRARSPWRPRLRPLPHRRTAEPHRPRGRTTRRTTRGPGLRPARRRLQVQQIHRRPAHLFHQGARQPAARHQTGRAALAGEAASDVGGGRAGGGVLVEACLGHLAQLAGQPVQLGRLVHHPVEQRRRGVAREGRRAGRRVREDGAEGEDVRRAGHALAEDLLGGHVAGRADRDAGRGQRRRSVRGPRDAEVDQQGAVEGEEHVGRLHVPVHQAQAVHRRQRLGEPRAQRAHGVFGQGAQLGDGGREEGPAA